MVDIMDHRQIVYLLTNKTMRNIVYVGVSSIESASLEIALMFLGNEGVPCPFDLVYAAFLDEKKSAVMDEVFGDITKATEGEHLNNGFYYLDVSQAKKIIEGYCEGDVTQSLSLQLQIIDTMGEVTAVAA
jgi:hypothetical protein